MGIIEDKRKFKRKVEQSQPTNPYGNKNNANKEFDIDSDTIKDKQHKK